MPTNHSMTKYILMQNNGSAATNQLHFYHYGIHNQDISMIHLRYLAGAAVLATAISSCDEDTLTIGQTLTDTGDKLNLVTANFGVTTQSIIADSVLSLSNNCYFGKIKDPETGANVKSEFTTQFHIVEDPYIAPEDSIIGQNNGRASADSCDIVLYLSSPFRPADSLSAMKMRVHELDHPIEENQFFYSNYNPMDMQLIRKDEGAVNKGKIFSYLNLTDNDSLRKTTNYITNIRIPLNDPYTDKKGVTYNNYGTYIMHQYYDNRSSFRNSYTFAHDVCPGFFFELLDGSGFHASVTDIGLRIFYTAHRDSIIRGSIVMAGTKEVLQTTTVTNDKQAIAKLAAESNHTYLKSPAGLFTEITLPVDQIVN